MVAKTRSKSGLLHTKHSSSHKTHSKVSEEKEIKKILCQGRVVTRIALTQPSVRDVVIPVNAVRGYKIFGPEFRCRGEQYAVGSVASLPPGLVINPGYRGFHFCRNAVDCLKYYSAEPTYKYAKVVALGDVREDHSKCCTNKLLVEKELTRDEFLDLCTGTVVRHFSVQTYRRGEMHSFNDKPCDDYIDGSIKAWKDDGVFHRLTGPVIIEKPSFGTWCALWKRNNIQARVGGPCGIFVSTAGVRFAYDSGFEVEFSPFNLMINWPSDYTGDTLGWMDASQDDAFGSRRYIKQFMAIKDSHRFLAAAQDIFDVWTKQPLDLVGNDSDSE